MTFRLILKPETQSLQVEGEEWEPGEGENTNDRTWESLNKTLARELCVWAVITSEEWGESEEEKSLCREPNKTWKYTIG